jgi:hypothetical protein
MLKCILTILFKNVLTFFSILLPLICVAGKELALKRCYMRERERETEREREGQREHFFFL